MCYAGGAVSCSPFAASGRLERRCGREYEVARQGPIEVDDGCGAGRCADPWYAGGVGPVRSARRGAELLQDARAPDDLYDAAVSGAARAGEHAELPGGAGNGGQRPGARVLERSVLERGQWLRRRGAPLRLGAEGVRNGPLRAMDGARWSDHLGPPVGDQGG